MNQTTRGLNNYQKRLVHQLVRADFPKLVSIGRPTFVQIIAYDAEREDAIRQSRARGFEEQLSRQTGLRWLVEAMVGGDLSGIDAKSFARNTTGEPIFADLEALKSHLAAVKEELQSRRTVLVGHNLFTDLLYFYQCFFGQLPDRVEDFQQTIHSLFPMVIDTKYLATHNCGSISPKSSLEEIEDSVRSLPLPLLGKSSKASCVYSINDHVEVHFDHPKYSTQFVPHEAGYDALLTAKILIRLSAQLEAAGTYVHEKASPNSSDDENYETAPEEGGPSSDRARKRRKSTAAKQTPSPEALKPSDAEVVAKGVSLGETETKPTKKARRRARKPTIVMEEPMERSAFAHTTKFNLLEDLPSDEKPIAKLPHVAQRGGAASAEPATEGSSQPELKPKRDDMMPPFPSDFWRVYGNKLRVFGTVEGLCDLTKF